MLKYFYKTILISLLSCTLMMVDFNSKVPTLNGAQAETVKTDGVKDSDLMATLTMAGVGLLTSRLYTCKLTADMMLAAGGGAAFIAGEILSTIKLRKVMKDMETEITRDAKGNINKEQIESLERLKKSYEEAKKTANTKKMLQQAAAAAFLAAAAAAYVLDGVEKKAFELCRTSLGKNGSACLGLTPATGSTVSLLVNLEAGRYVPSPSAAGKAKETAADAARSASEKTTTGQSTSLTTSYQTTCSNPYGGEWACPYVTTCSQATAEIPAACAAITPTLSQSSGFCPVPLSLSASNFQNTNYKYAFSPKNPMLMLSRYFFGTDAQADLFTPLGIASSAAVTYLLATSTTLGATIDSYLLAPMNRAIIWGVLAGLSFAASTSTSNVISKIEANIQKIDAILKSMYSMANGATTTQVANAAAPVSTTVKPNQNIEFNANDYSEVDLSKEGEAALPCVTKMENGKCKTLESALSETPSFANLSAESQKQLASILQTANGFNGTNKISSGTLASAAGLANSANALRSAVDKAKAAAAERLKKAGSKFNIDEQSKKFSNALEKNVKDGLKKANTNASGMLSSMYGSRSGTGASDSGNSNAAKEVATDLKKLAPVANAIDISSPSAGPGTGDIGLSGLNTGDKQLSAEELAKLDAASAAAAGKDTIDAYEIKGDINQDSSSSIFELISNRYQHSAYPRLFKVKEPVSEAPVNK